MMDFEQSALRCWALLCVFAASCAAEHDGNTIGSLDPERNIPFATAEHLGISSSGGVLDMVSADLDGDGSLETVAITFKKVEGGIPLGGEVVVLKVNDGVLTPVWRQRKLNPWKVQLADVDSRPGVEVVVGVWKTSPRDPVMARRPFVYGWNGRRLVPKWLGSRLSRRFTDMAVGDVDCDGRNELVSLEVAPGKRNRVAVYRWFSFGFEWLGCSEERAGMEMLRGEAGRVTVVIRGREHCVRLFDGRVTTEPVERCRHEQGKKVGSLHDGGGTGGRAVVVFGLHGKKVR